MGFLDVSSFQKCTFEMNQKFVRTYLKLRLDGDPMGYELILSSRYETHETFDVSL